MKRRVDKRTIRFLIGIVVIGFIIGLIVMNLGGFSNEGKGLKGELGSLNLFSSDLEVLEKDFEKDSGWVEEMTLPEEFEEKEMKSNEMTIFSGELSILGNPFYSDDLNLNDNVLILYNSNSREAIEIAEYYATKRGIDFSRICEVKLPPGQFATASQLRGARKTIVEDCLCEIIDLDLLDGECDVSNIKNIAEISPITHFAIIKGIPSRLTDTGWRDDSEEPSFDFFLSYMFYREGNFFEESFTGKVPWMNYSGYYENNIDFQSGYSYYSYVRPIDVSFDKIVAYGRIEAINKARTFDLIDRILKAEGQGFRGNFLSGMMGSMNQSILPDPDENILYNFFKDLSSSRGIECREYLDKIDPDDFRELPRAWPYESCRTGTNRYGSIPGEPYGNIKKAINAGIFLGEDPYPNGFKGFDGFFNMLNWRKNGGECIALCKDFVEELDRESCRLESEDYFQEINSDCVGVADGFLGWQSRSWPVQYYGFYPQGWTTTEEGAREKTVPFILSGDAYIDDKFIDNKYLRFGALDSVDNPNCLLEDGNEISCKEIVAPDIYYKKDFDEGINLEEAGVKNYVIKMRYRNSPTNNGRFIIRFTAISNNEGEKNYYDEVVLRINTNEEHLDWETIEFDVSIDSNTFCKFKGVVEVCEDMSNSNFGGIKLYLFSYLNSHKMEGWFEIDGVEIIDKDTGEELIEREIGSFNALTEQTVSGDWAANVIDRLGGIAWWGSSSHFITGGWAFLFGDRFAGAFFSGRTLGESLMHNGRNAMSGIIYGDPLYRPSAVKIYIWEENTVLLNSINDGYDFELGEKKLVDLTINALHGQDNILTTNWALYSCLINDIDDCDKNDGWTEFFNETGAVFGEKVNVNLMEFVINPDEAQSFVIKLRVWNEGEENNDLVNYAFFNYLYCIDNDGDGYKTNCGFEDDCDDDDDSIWRYSMGYLDEDLDGYGIGNELKVCIGENFPEGYSINNNDCDENNPAILDTIVHNCVSDCEEDSDCGSSIFKCYGNKCVSPLNCYGADLNLNGEVDRWVFGGITDYDILFKNWDRDDCNEFNNWCERADINHDFVVNNIDLEILNNHMGMDCNWEGCFDSCFSCGNGDCEDYENNVICPSDCTQSFCSDCDVLGFGCNYDKCHSLGECFYAVKFWSWEEDCVDLAGACLDIEVCGDYSDEECGGDVCDVSVEGCELEEGECVEAEPEDIDSDNDGVLDEDDMCGNTIYESVDDVNNQGCLKPKQGKFDILFNLQEEDISNIESFEIGIVNRGRIRYNNNVSLLRVVDGNQVRLDLDLYINFFRHRVELNSSALPELNVSAVITMYNVSLVNPVVKMDGVVCDLCNVTYWNVSEGVFEFNVSHFSVFELVEAENCGDGDCNNGESCSNCALDCGVCPVVQQPSSGRSSSSGTIQMVNETIIFVNEVNVSTDSNLTGEENQTVSIVEKPFWKSKVVYVSVGISAVVLVLVIAVLIAYLYLIRKKEI